MSKCFLLAVTAALLMATTAHAQFGGGAGGGGGSGGGGAGGGGHGRHGGGQSQGKPAPTNGGSKSAAIPTETPLDEIQIVGVIKALDPTNDRVTIAYEPVEALNWTKGTMPFVVAKSALLKGATVGEKVRFKMQSQQISELKPF